MTHDAPLRQLKSAWNPPQARSRSRSTCALWIVLALASSVVGCRFSIARVRKGQPIKHEKFDDLKLGETKRTEVLDEMGAPDIVRWENGKSRLTWQYIDTTVFETRAQVPIALFGYRHNLFRYFQNRDNANTLDLVFDDEGTLSTKSLRLPKSYREEEEDDGSRWQLTPRFEHSFFLGGDAGAADY
ncbi:MAG: hypothetical protein AAF517_26605, partial [Planctomycetota bacterium]